MEIIHANTDINNIVIMMTRQPTGDRILTLIGMIVTLILIGIILTLTHNVHRLTLILIGSPPARAPLH